MDIFLSTLINCNEFAFDTSMKISGLASNKNSKVPALLYPTDFAIFNASSHISFLFSSDNTTEGAISITF